MGKNTMQRQEFIIDNLKIELDLTEDVEHDIEEAKAEAVAEHVSAEVAAQVLGEVRANCKIGSKANFLQALKTKVLYAIGLICLDAKKNSLADRIN